MAKADMFTESHNGFDDIGILILPAFISVSLKEVYFSWPRGVTRLPRWAQRKARACALCQVGCIDLEDRFDDVERRNKMLCHMFPGRNEMGLRQTRSGVYRRRNIKETINPDIEEAAMGARERAGPSASAPLLASLQIIMTHVCCPRQGSTGPGLMRASFSRFHAPDFLTTKSQLILPSLTLLSSHPEHCHPLPTNNRIIYPF
jgi:hypothetical protein